MPGNSHTHCPDCGRPIRRHGPPYVRTVYPPDAEILAVFETVGLPVRTTAVAAGPESSQWIAELGVDSDGRLRRIEVDSLQALWDCWRTLRILVVDREVKLKRRLGWFLTGDLAVRDKIRAWSGGAQIPGAQLWPAPTGPCWPSLDWPLEGTWEKFIADLDRLPAWHLEGEQEVETYLQEEVRSFIAMVDADRLKAALLSATAHARPKASRI